MSMGALGFKTHSTTRVSTRPDAGRGAFCKVSGCPAASGGRLEDGGHVERARRLAERVGVHAEAAEGDAGVQAQRRRRRVRRRRRRRTTAAGARRSGACRPRAAPGCGSRRAPCQSRAAARSANQPRKAALSGISGWSVGARRPPREDAPQVVRDAAAAEDQHAFVGQRRERARRARTAAPGGRPARRRAARPGCRRRDRGSAARSRCRGRGRLRRRFCAAIPAARSSAATRAASAGSPGGVVAQRVQAADRSRRSRRSPRGAPRRARTGARAAVCAETGRSPAAGRSAASIAGPRRCMKAPAAPGSSAIIGEPCETKSGGQGRCSWRPLKHRRGRRRSARLHAAFATRVTFRLR